jgi:hypothetical protein
MPAVPMTPTGNRKQESQLRHSQRRNSQRPTQIRDPSGRQGLRRIFNTTNYPTTAKAKAKKKLLVSFYWCLSALLCCCIFCTVSSLELAASDLFRAPTARRRGPRFLRRRRRRRFSAADPLYAFFPAALYVAMHYSAADAGGHRGPLEPAAGGGVEREVAGDVEVVPAEGGRAQN